MTRAVCLAAVLMLLACKESDPEGADGNNFRAGTAAVMPDTATVDGVLMISHSDGAFERAPQLTIAATPEVVISGGDDPENDLSNTYPPQRFADGRFLIAGYRPARLMLFGADGKPVGVIAREGSGPTDVNDVSAPLLIAPDTVIIRDGANSRVIWITADSGVVASHASSAVSRLSSYSTHGVIGDRMAAISRSLNTTGDPKRAERLPTPVILASFDMTTIDTVSIIPGFEMIMMESRYRGQRREVKRMLRFGQAAYAIGWAGSLVTANGEHGYALNVGTLARPEMSRITVQRPRRAVTEAMRQAQIASELARIDEPRSEGFVDVEETRRQAREAPFADSLPPYGALFTSTDDVLWVVDYIAPSDSVVTATGFRVNGPILARLTIPRNARPVWFGAGEVMLREEDEGGAVSYAIYAMTPTQRF